LNSTAYDLVVIGSGPAGQKAAIAASKLGKKVAVIDRKEMVGGVCLHTGTIPSKTLREAIMYLSGFREKSFYGKDYTVNREITVADLAFRVQKVMAKEMEVVRAQLARNHVATVHGRGRFTDPHTVEVDTAEGPVVLTGEHVLIACGTRPAHTPTVPLDGERIIDSDQLLEGKTLPRDLIVVGAGVIGLEYASMVTALNIKVTVKIARASGDGDTITLQKTVPRAAQGETIAVALPLNDEPPIGTALNISVNVAKVPGEENLDNNKATYPALFDQG